MRKFKVLFVPGLVVVVSLALFAQEPQGRGGQGAPPAARRRSPCPTVKRRPGRPRWRAVAREVAEEEVVVVESEGVGVAAKTSRCSNKATSPKPCSPSCKRWASWTRAHAAYCHVEDRSSDEKRPKVVARRMITMMRAINGTFPDGQQHVTCYTCHRGNTKPLMEPAF